jgi:hypothetical protein
MLRLCGKDATDELQAYCHFSRPINVIHGSESKSQEAAVYAPYLTKNCDLVSVSCSSGIDLVVRLQEPTYSLTVERHYATMTLRFPFSSHKAKRTGQLWRTH